MNSKLALVSMSVMLCLLGGVNYALAQQSSSQTNSASSAPGNANDSTVIDQLPAVRNAFKENLQDLTARVLKLEIDNGKSTRSSDGHEIKTSIIAGFVALIAALIGGGLALLTAYLTARRERVMALELARKQAVFQQMQKILEFRIDQMKLFYAPMFAFLQQSESLYNKMSDQLAQDEPERYRIRPMPDAYGHRLEVLASDGQWKSFRLLDQLPAIRKHAKTFVLVTRIVEIGAASTKIISRHAGLASSELIAILGDYLAHYALLSTIYNSLETEPYEPQSHKIGYFSKELNSKVEEGYRELSKFLDGYEMASKSILADFACQKAGD